MYKARQGNLAGLAQAPNQINFYISPVPSALWLSSSLFYYLLMKVTRTCRIIRLTFVSALDR